VAQQVVVHLVDDLDGSEATTTVEFALDGKSYTIDLSDGNVGRLREALEPFVEAARRTGTRRRERPSARPQQPSRPSGSDREYNNSVRQWARKNGWDIAARGRIPASVIDAYENRNA